MIGWEDNDSVSPESSLSSSWDDEDDPPPKWREREAR